MPASLSSIPASLQFEADLLEEIAWAPTQPNETLTNASLFGIGARKFCALSQILVLPGPMTIDLMH